MKFKEVKKIFPDATDDQIQDVLDAVHNEIDDLRNQLDKAQKNADPEGWKKNMIICRTNMTSTKLISRRSRQMSPKEQLLRT